MDLEDLQVELMQVQNRMDTDMQNGLGWATEDVHLAGELLAKIKIILASNEGAE